MPYKIISNTGGSEYFGERSTIYPFLEIFLEPILSKSQSVHLNTERIYQFRSYVFDQMYNLIESHNKLGINKQRSRVVDIELDGQMITLNLHSKNDKMLFDWYGLFTFLNHVIDSESEIKIEVTLTPI